MIEPIRPPMGVTVRRFADRSPEDGLLTHGVYMSVLGRDGRSEERGAFLGFGIETDRGFIVYGQPHQITDKETGQTLDKLR